MEIPSGTPTRAAVIGKRDGPSFTVQVPTPYSAGYVCDEAHASILNQTLRENLSNNLREQLTRGFEVKAPADGVEGEYRPYTEEEAQALVDAYVVKYTPGVRSSGGGGGTRALSPVEVEVRNLATAKLKEALKARGLKQSDVNFTELRDKLITQHGEALTKQAVQVVKAREKAASGDDADLLSTITDGLPGVGGEGSGDQTEPGAVG